MINIDNLIRAVNAKGWIQFVIGESESFHSMKNDIIQYDFQSK